MKQTRDLPLSEKMYFEYDFDGCKGYPFYITYEQALHQVVVQNARFKDSESRDNIIQMLKQFDYRPLCDDNREMLKDLFEEDAHNEFLEECENEKIAPCDIGFWDEINRRVDEVLVERSMD